MAEKERYRYIVATNKLYDSQEDELYFYNINSNKVISILNQQDKRIKDLEEQIKTKDTINNLYKTTVSLRDNDFKDLVYENNELKQENKQLKQSQKQLAIIKLKQIIYFMENSSNNHYPLPYEIKNFIENQIKDLEGIKNE